MKVLEVVVTESNANFDDIVAYTLAYSEAYRRNFEDLISPARKGGGLPKVPYPPYCSSAPLDCYIGTNGVVFIDQSEEPSYQWHIAGGPALCVDYEPTRAPQFILDVLENEGLTGKPIGIYRIVGKNLSEDVWQGQLPTPSQTKIEITSYEKILTFHDYKIPVAELIEKLTYGAFGPILDVHLKSNADDFWDNFRVQRLGFFPSDRRSKRFFRLFEFVHNTSSAAWDTRSLWLRVKFDCYRDILSAHFLGDDGGGTMNFSSKNTDIEKLLDKTKPFETAIDELRTTLFQSQDEREGVFQKILEKYPLILDVYGAVVARPRFYYPDGQSPTEKLYVEPDFVIKYKDGSYRIVEIERPNKRLTTSSGQGRSEVTQAVFQLSEFRNFVEKHASVLQQEFPGIRASNCRYTLIIGRERDDDLGTFVTFDELRLHLAGTYNVDEVWVYDDLVGRAQMAVDAIRGLSHFSS
jgi:antiviral defense system Shedu protein SduA